MYQLMVVLGGAAARAVGGWYEGYASGISGTAGTNRGTGGGGSGTAHGRGGITTGYAGSTGTSYSGGIGGNGIDADRNSPLISSGANYSSGGTGGLLIVYSDSINGNGIYIANGYSGYRNGESAGGSSGGGSINIFYETSCEEDIITKNTKVSGGASISVEAYNISHHTLYSGAGGNGTANIKQINLNKN